MKSCLFSEIACRWVDMISERIKLCGALAMNESALDGMSSVSSFCDTTKVSIAGTQVIQEPNCRTHSILSVIVLSLIRGLTPSCIRTTLSCGKCLSAAASPLYIESCPVSPPGTRNPIFNTRNDYTVNFRTVLKNFQRINDYRFPTQLQKLFRFPVSIHAPARTTGKNNCYIHKSEFIYPIQKGYIFLLQYESRNIRTGIQLTAKIHITV